MAVKADIAAIKLTAVTGRGSKKRLFRYFLPFSFFSLETMIQLYDKKHPDGSDLLVIKSLTYAKDAKAFDTSTI